MASTFWSLAFMVMKTPPGYSSMATGDDGPLRQGAGEGPDWFLVATEACGGGTFYLISVLKVLGYESIYGCRGSPCRTLISLLCSSPPIEVDLWSVETGKAACGKLDDYLYVVLNATFCVYAAMQLSSGCYSTKQPDGSFKMHAWISVSQDYNEVTLLKEVLRNIGVHSEQGESITELQRKLAQTIKGKSFFLVLDDVWHSNVWIDLLRPAFRETSVGIILVTTRDYQITKRIGVDHTHQVDLMSVEVGWELLWKSMNIKEEKEVRNLRKTGIEIVHKCGRLPLAIKVTASALSSRELTDNEWKRYLGRFIGSQSILLDETEEALYLSYDELSHRLKQCFLYCALYVEDSVIKRDEVTWLWIAEGFIEEQQGQLIEDIEKTTTMS
ncbi:Disease resistance RPP13-like protein 4 [Triticum urartu]|uniref:Disease resistance RPP13-like protein 4 n=1 Tax=Triticum urartu TaxID=4572 RepID=M8ASP0_TRIUA|nr:Disease resistance RPP13-like protein 4 [Triticum urartu]